MGKKPRNPHPKIEHLKPWKPGQSGNPGGRPKGIIDRRAERAIWARVLKSPLSEIRQMADRDISGMEAVIAASILRAAATGEASAVSLCLERAIGKVKEEIDLPSEGQETLEVIPEEKLLSLITPGDEVAR